MKTINIVEGIMSLVGKVGKAFNKLNKLTKNIKTQMANGAEIYKVDSVKVEGLAAEGMAVEQGTLQVERDNHLHREQQLREEALEKMLAKKEEQQLLKEEDKLATGTALLKVKSLRLEQRLQRAEGHRLQDKNKGVIIPLHRRGAYQMKHKVSKSQGKVVYLHQREPTASLESTKSAYDREKGTGS